jgi:uncharacterized peroxidase-related enzyme
MGNIEKKVVELEPQSIESAHKISSDIMNAANKGFGFIPNMYSLMANNPALLDSYTYSYQSFRANSGFNPVEQEVILLSISYENECDYCMGAHSFVADKMSKVPEKVTNAIRNGEEIPDAKLAALSKFTREIVINRGRVSEEDVNCFLDAGFTKEQVLGVVTAIGIKTMSNYFNHLAGTLLDEAFSERAWVKIASVD